MDLREATRTLMRQPDIARQLRLVDSYIQAYNRLPDQFVLPSDHALLKPIIEAFASDITAFAQYIKTLRDASETHCYDELHDLYRTIDMRAMQAARRTRIRKAVVVLMPEFSKALGRELTYEEQLKMARFIEHRWGAMRLAHMDEERRKHHAKRLPAEERTTTLAQFWKSVETALENNTVPLGSEGYKEELLAIINGGPL